MATTTQSARPIAATHIGYFRWIICGLLFLASTINYVDRQVIGLLKPGLQAQFGWTEIDYADIIFAFQLAYAIGFVFAGRFIDKVGTRLGFSIALLVWSAAAMAHAFAPAFGPAMASVLGAVGFTYTASVAGFMTARFLLGIGESGNFPAAIKTVAEWFPRRERALATGIFNAGSNVGAIVAPLVVPWIALTWGWRAAFVATGALGFAWLAVWLAVYRAPAEQRRLSPRERAYIESDPPESVAHARWRDLAMRRETWAFAAGKALTDPIWLFYLFWLPKFLDSNWGVHLDALAAPLIAIYVVADVGSVAGGWLSSHLIVRGWSVNAARKTAMLVAALCIVPTAFAPLARSMWLAVAIVAVAAAAHQWWSANLFTLVSDMFPRQAVGSVVGIGGFAGALSAVVFQRVTGKILDATHGRYGVVFIICGSAYVVAIGVIQLLVPRIGADGERHAASA
jgi:ACS family hexuronate transporter-like MFS transporter